MGTCVYNILRSKGCVYGNGDIATKSYMAEGQVDSFHIHRQSHGIIVIISVIQYPSVCQLIPNSAASLD